MSGLMFLNCDIWNVRATMREYTGVWTYFELVKSISRGIWTSLQTTNKLWLHSLVLWVPWEHASLQRASSWRCFSHVHVTSQSLQALYPCLSLMCVAEFVPWHALAWVALKNTSATMGGPFAENIQPWRCYGFRVMIIVVSHVGTHVLKIRHLQCTDGHGSV